MREVHVTEAGKKIQLIVDKISSQLRFQFSPGGELPQELSGTFTQDKYAFAALNRYIEKTKPKAK